MSDNSTMINDRNCFNCGNVEYCKINVESEINGYCYKWIPDEFNFTVLNEN